MLEPAGWRGDAALSAAVSPWTLNWSLCVLFCPHMKLTALTLFIFEDALLNTDVADARTMLQHQEMVICYKSNAALQEMAPMHGQRHAHLTTLQVQPGYRMCTQAMQVLSNTALEEIKGNKVRLVLQIGLSQTDACCLSKRFKTFQHIHAAGGTRRLRAQRRSSKLPARHSTRSRGTQPNWYAEPACDTTKATFSTS